MSIEALREAVGIAIAKINGGSDPAKWLLDTDRGINAKDINRAAGRDIVITTPPVDHEPTTIFVAIVSPHSKQALVRWLGKDGAVHGVPPQALVTVLQSWAALEKLPPKPRKKREKRGRKSEAIRNRRWAKLLDGGMTRGEVKALHFKETGEEVETSTISRKAREARAAEKD